MARLEQEARYGPIPVNEESVARSGQLPLGISLPDNVRFESFVAGPNAELVRVLRDMASGDGEMSLYLWGQVGLGKTHLLQAACRAAGQHALSCAFLPLSDFSGMTTGVLQDMASLDLLCVDDLDAVAGSNAWERALFDLFNQARAGGCRLVMSGSVRADHLGLNLPDLVSRLTWGPVYPLRALDDAGLLAALQLRARTRGFELPDETGLFLLRRYPRDLPALCALLDRLDHASLVAQRRLTIPFVKTALEN